MPVPSKVTMEGSLEDLKRKNTDEDMMIRDLVHGSVKQVGVVTEV
jgi:hypothetical protein